MGLFNSKHEEDENCLRIEDLPDEMMLEIFSNLNNNEKMKASMVNRRWFGIVNNEIKTLSVKLPQEENQEFLNLIERFPNLKNVEINGPIEIHVLGRLLGRFPYSIIYRNQWTINNYRLFG